eukprot:10184397-Alexandrium_andersonii.AAC.1
MRKLGRKSPQAASATEHKRRRAAKVTGLGRLSDVPKQPPREVCNALESRSARAAACPQDRQ